MAGHYVHWYGSDFIMASCNKLFHLGCFFTSRGVYYLYNNKQTNIIVLPAGCAGLEFLESWMSETPIYSISSPSPGPRLETY